MKTPIFVKLFPQQYITCSIFSDHLDHIVLENKNFMYYYNFNYLQSIVF